jgi:RNA polymerase sigma-70 factor, ECF subfamily
VAEPAAHDTELTTAIRLAQDGDEDAFRTVYRCVQPRLLRYLRSMLDDHDAQDIAAEVWAHIAQDLSTFHGDADGFRGWAATIGRNRALTLLRHRHRRRHWHHPLEECADRPSADDPATEAIDILSTRQALALVRTLPAHQAEAVLLHVMMGLDYPTAAQVLGRRPGAVRTAGYRGLKQLAERLRVPGPAPASLPAPAWPPAPRWNRLMPAGE